MTQDEAVVDITRQIERTTRGLSDGAYMEVLSEVSSYIEACLDAKREELAADE